MIYQKKMAVKRIAYIRINILSFKVSSVHIDCYRSKSNHLKQIHLLNIFTSYILKILHHVILELYTFSEKLVSSVIIVPSGERWEQAQLAHRVVLTMAARMLYLLIISNIHFHIDGIIILLINLGNLFRINKSLKSMQLIRRQEALPQH